MLNVIPIFGGYFSIITSLFITVPVLLFSRKGFITHMVKYLHRKEKKKKHQKRKDITEEEIEKLYLKRVSHEGIYSLYD